jgi:hypothetical protein
MICGTPQPACGYPVALTRRQLQAWMGRASIATTNLYLHHLGTPADRAGLDRLNDRGK